MIDPAELMTQLTLFDGTHVKFKISYQNNHGSEFINIFVIGETSELIGRNNIGELRFDMNKNPISELPVLYIIGMDNFTSHEHLKRKVFHVGSLLHEIAFRLSVLRGCEGRVEFSVARNSGLFHKKWGFVTTDARMNEKLDAEIESRKEKFRAGKRYDSEWNGLGNGCWMFLPPEAIQKKMRDLFKAKAVSPANVTFFNGQSTVRFNSQRLTALVSQKKISAYTASYLEGNLLVPEFRDQVAWDAILSANGLWLMRSGYLPSYYACVYFSQYNSEKLAYLVSDDALDLFSKNLIAWQDFVNVSIAHVRFILCSYGIQLLHKSHMTIDKIKILPYEVVESLDESVPCYRKVYQALAFNLISFEYLQQKHQEMKHSLRDYWNTVSREIDDRSIGKQFIGPRAKDNDNDKKFELLSLLEAQTLITAGIITWLDFVVSFPAPAMDNIEKTRFALAPGMLQLLGNKTVHIDDLKNLSYIFIKDFNRWPHSIADKFYYALANKYITPADVKSFCSSRWDSKQLQTDFENFLDQRSHAKVSRQQIM